MAFTLKKIISFFLMPLSLVLLVFLLSLYFLFTQQYKKAKVWLSIALFALFLSGFAPLSNALVKPLENHYEKVTTYNEEVNYILLLGGNFKSRGYEALRLYHQLDNVKIVTSGYGGYNPKSDALSAAEKLMAVGVKKEDIIIEEESKDTHDEALMMKKKVKNQPFYLVTSALHMPRAVMLFEKEGLNPIPSPTDYIQIEHMGMLNLFTSGNVLSTQKAMHEYLGIAYTKLKEGLQTIKGLF